MNLGNKKDITLLRPFIKILNDPRYSPAQAAVELEKRFPEKAVEDNVEIEFQIYENTIVLQALGLEAEAHVMWTRFTKRFQKIKDYKKEVGLSQEMFEISQHLNKKFVTKIPVTRNSGSRSSEQSNVIKEFN